MAAIVCSRFLRVVFVLVTVVAALGTTARAQPSLNKAPETTSLREAPLAGLYGKRAGKILGIQARRGASVDVQAGLAQGSIGPAHAMSAAATGIFGAKGATEPILYQQFSEKLAAVGLDREIGSFIKNLTPTQQASFYDGMLTPREIFASSVRERLSWKYASTPVDFAALTSHLERDGQGMALRRAVDAMNPNARARLMKGKMPGAEMAQHLKTAMDMAPDVVIVGAGMAGVTAAHELRRQGKHVVILEAGDRAGGRSHTDRTKLGLPLDIGATWLHNSGENALTPIAKKLGLDVVLDTTTSRQVYDGKNLKAADDFDALVDSKLTRIEERGLKGDDVKATRAAPRGTGLSKAADHYAAGLMVGVNGLEQASTKDLAHTGHEVNDAFVTQGLGSIAEAYTHGLEVKTNARVSSVSSKGETVEVVANGKTYHAKQVLITTSPGVLAAGHIKFDPPLQPGKQEALKQIKMANFTKVFASYRKGALSHFAPNSRVIDVSDPKAPLEYVIRPFGADAVIVMSGGSQAKAFEAMGERKSVAHVVKRLDRILGKPLSKNFHAGTMTRFNSDPNTRGTWGYARPGGYDGRKELAKPIDGKIFFAGEAITKADWTMTLTGAHLSGHEAVTKMNKAKATARQEGKLKVSPLRSKTPHVDLVKSRGPRLKTNAVRSPGSRTSRRGMTKQRVTPKVRAHR